ncbi:hypothetical protein B0H19DRAFT_180965 [Mycena capillaripes]|nr:hypothetical protein B0H19DRAFT_180965 [Mycena capillaripes]
MDLFNSIDDFAAAYTNPFPPWQFDAPLDDPPPRIALPGSLDPTTGIFTHSPKPPRTRATQACLKCRERKAKV